MHSKVRRRNVSSVGSDNQGNEHVHPEVSVLQIKLCDSLKAFKNLLNCHVGLLRIKASRRRCTALLRILHILLLLLFYYCYYYYTRYTAREQVNANSYVHLNETINLKYKCR